MRQLSALFAILSSVLVLIAGNGLMNTLVPYRAKLEHFPDQLIGMIGSAYFVGMLAGTIIAPRLIRRAGFIRAFAAFTTASMMTVPSSAAAEPPGLREIPASPRGGARPSRTSNPFRRAASGGR